MSNHTTKVIVVSIISAALTAAWVAHDTGTWVEFENGTKGFACRCYNSSGSLTWYGKVGSTSCPNVSASIAPGIPKAVANRTFDTTSCCTTTPTRNNGQTQLPLPSSC